MTDQVRVIIKAEDQGGQKAISDFSRGLEGAAVTAEKSATRQVTSFVKVRAELEKADLAVRRSSAETARQREADSQKTVTALIDDARRLQAAQRKSALDSAAVFVAAERQKQAEVARISQQSRETLARGLKQQEADHAASVEAIRRRNAASATAENTLEEALARRRSQRTETLLREAEARRRARAREFEEASRGARIGNAAGSFASGVGAAAGVGFGAGPLGAGIATALGVGFSSLQAIEFERANAALTAVTGSSTEAGQALAFVREQADRLGVSVTTLSLQYSRFEAAAKGTALEGGRTRDIFLAVTEAGQRLNLRAEQVEGSLNAISQIISKGSVQAEELRGQLGDRLPGAFGIMARALGVTTRELDKMLRTGEVLASDALPKFATELRRTFDTDANTRINTTVSNFTRLANEIRIAASEFGGFVNRAAGPAAGFIAGVLERRRELNELEALPFSRRRAFASQEGTKGGLTLSQFLDQEREISAGIERDISAKFDTGAYLRPRRPAAAFRTVQDSTPAGEALLTSGQPPLDLTEFRNSNRQRLEAQGKLNEATQLEIFLQRQAAGEFAGKNAVIVENYRQIAIAEDQNAARLKAEREGKRGLRQEDQARTRELKAALEVEESTREEAERAIRANVSRAEILREEIRLGRELTAVERARITGRVNRSSIAGNTVEGSEDAATRADRDNALAQSLRAFQFSGAQRAGDISFDTGNLGQNDLGTRIANEQRQIELESRRLLVGATQEQTTAILAEADAQMQLVESLIKQQDLRSRDAVVSARRTLQQIERDSTNAATAVSEAITQGFRSAEEAAARFATTGKFSIRDFVSSALADLARLAAQRGVSGLLSIAGNALFGAAGGSGSAPSGGGLGSSLLGPGGIGGQFLGPGKADGGAVFGGTVYPVVERGKPEAFRSPRGDTYLIPPAGGGQVIPMNASGGGATQTIALTLNIDARGATDPVAIQRAAKAAQREIAATFARKNARGIATAD